MGSNQVSFSDKLDNKAALPEEVKQDPFFMIREVLAPVVVTNASDRYEDLLRFMGRETTVKQFAELSTLSLLSREKG